jgi:hypothetical protein
VGTKFIFISSRGKHFHNLAATKGRCWIGTLWAWRTLANPTLLSHTDWMIYGHDFHSKHYFYFASGQMA